MGRLIKRTRIGGKIIINIILFLGLPSFSLGLPLGFSNIFWLLFCLNALILIIVLVFKLNRLYVYDSGLVKEYFFLSRKLQYTPEKIHFKFGDWRQYAIIPNVIAYRGKEILGSIDFASDRDIEKFVKVTKSCGYSWSLPHGSGEFRSRIKNILTNQKIK